MRPGSRKIRVKTQSDGVMKPQGLVRKSLQLVEGRIGFALMAAIIVLIIAGPLWAPYAATAIPAAPWLPLGSPGFILGTDFVGHDTLSRFLHGGALILVVSSIATIVGVGLGALLGIVAGYTKGSMGEWIMRALDVLLCFPAVVLALLFVALLGSSLPLLTAVVALTHIPRTARVLYSASLDVSGLDFVRYAELIGLSRFRIVVGEILPNVIAPLAVEVGLRLTWSVGIIASLSYLGLGIQPPAADWGLMINENQGGLSFQPWSVVLPVLAICVLSVGSNLFTDALSRSFNRNGAR